MYFRSALVFLLFIGFFLMLMSEEKVVFQRAPTEIQEGEKTILAFVVSGIECTPVRVRFFYRTDRDSVYKEFELLYRDGEYHFPILPEMIEGSKFFYYFLVVECENGAIYGFPSGNPMDVPMRIKIKNKVIE